MEEASQDQGRSREEAAPRRRKRIAGAVARQDDRRSERKEDQETRRGARVAAAQRAEADSRRRARDAGHRQLLGRRAGALADAEAASIRITASAPSSAIEGLVELGMTPAQAIVAATQQWRHRGARHDKTSARSRPASSPTSCCSHRRSAGRHPQPAQGRDGLQGRTRDRPRTAPRVACVVDPAARASNQIGDRDERQSSSVPAPISSRRHRRYRYRGRAPAPPTRRPRRAAPSGRVDRAAATPRPPTTFRPSIRALRPMTAGIVPIADDERTARIEKARRLMAENQHRRDLSSKADRACSTSPASAGD